MKKIVFISILLLQSCNAQKVINYSQEEEINYIFSNLETKIKNYFLFNKTINVRIYTMLDWKLKSKNIEDYQSSLFISITEDGETPLSKLYKIEGLYAPKVLTIKELNYPEFEIEIEYGGNKKLKYTHIFKCF